MDQWNFKAVLLVSFYLIDLSQLTRREVHTILVITALEGVQGSGDLAGELLAPIHTLPLQVVAQVRYVILVPEGMR